MTAVRCAKTPVPDVGTSGPLSAEITLPTGTVRFSAVLVDGFNNAMMVVDSKVIIRSRGGRIMKIKRCALIFLFAFTLLFSGVSAVHAEAPAFNLTYDKTSDSFFVRGEAEAGSRVLLLVYSPTYEGAFIEDLYYMDAKNDVNGAYEFCVKMKDAVSAGRAQFPC